MTPDGAGASGSMRVAGTGSALPGAPVATEVLLARVAAHLPAGTVRVASRIARRLGIDARHLARALADPVEGTRALDSAPRLAAAAVAAALAQAKFPVRELDFMIGHTATPHTPLPSNTAWTADELDYSGPHVELRQACTGFAAAATLADAMLRSTQRHVAIVGSETGSTFFDPRRVAADTAQLVNLVQMGDGAGSIIVAQRSGADDSRIEHVYFGSAGLGREPGLTVASGGSAAPLAPGGGVPQFTHRFAAIREHGIDLLRASLTAATAAGVALDSIQWFLPHQANGRMPELCARYFGLPRAQVICDAGQLGNLGSAAIWVSLDRLRRSGRLAHGDRLLVFGAEATKYLYGGFLYVHGRT